MYRKINCQKVVISKRLIIRSAKPTDENNFGIFMDRCDQSYPISDLGWPKKEGGYASKNCAGLIKYLDEHFIKNLYLFRKHTNEIIGSAIITTDRTRSIRVGYYVSPDFRRLGYGTESYEAILNSLSKINPKQIIQAQCEKNNFGSKAILIRNGFNMVGSRSPANFRYSSREKLLTFRRVL